MRICSKNDANNSAEVYKQSSRKSSQIMKNPSTSVQNGAKRDQHGAKRPQNGAKGGQEGAKMHPIIDVGKRVRRTIILVAKCYAF